MKGVWAISPDLYTTIRCVPSMNDQLATTHLPYKNAVCSIQPQTNSKDEDS